MSHINLCIFNRVSLQEKKELKMNDLT